MHGHLNDKFVLLTIYAHNSKQPIRAYSHKPGKAPADNEAMTANETPLSLI